MPLQSVFEIFCILFKYKLRGPWCLGAFFVKMIPNKNLYNCFLSSDKFSTTLGWLFGLLWWSKKDRKGNEMDYSFAIYIIGMFLNIQLFQHLFVSTDRNRYWRFQVFLACCESTGAMQWGTEKSSLGDKHILSFKPFFPYNAWII